MLQHRLARIADRVALTKSSSVASANIRNLNGDKSASLPSFKDALAYCEQVLELPPLQEPEDL